MNIYLVAAVWMGMALAAALISIRLGISVALVEILVGAIAGNVPFIARPKPGSDRAGSRGGITRGKQPHWTLLVSSNLSSGRAQTGLPVPQ